MLIMHEATVDRNKTPPGCIIFTIVQHTWNSMAILIVMEVFLVLITAGTGIIEGVLQMASESLGGFMRS